MAIVYDGPVLPDDLTTFVRAVPQPAQFILNQILPDDHVQTNRIDVGIITRTNRTARFRAYDANLHVAQRDVGQVTAVTLPPLSDSLAMGELERLKLEFARTGGTNQNAFVEAIYNDAETLTHYVQNRMELARGDVLVDGKFTLTGEGGLNIEADYGVPAGNFVTPGTLWSTTASADVLGDLNNWLTYYIGINGYAPEAMWVSRATLIQMLSNTAMRQSMATLVGVAALLTREQLDAGLASRGLPRIAGVYDANVDVDGVITRTVPANKVIFTPPAGTPFGRTLWGVSATALELVNSGETEMSFEDAPGIVGVVEKSGPPYREFTFVDAVGMPVLDNPKALMVATVA
ncbi:MAG: major capsid protein [Mycobacteriaceae bacterium]